MKFKMLRQILSKYCSVTKMKKNLTKKNENLSVKKYRYSPTLSQVKYMYLLIIFLIIRPMMI